MFMGLPLIAQKSGVDILGYSFSEAQTGKGPADRGAAYIKRLFRYYINSKHDILDVADMLKAIREANNAKGISFFACEPNSKSSEKGTIPNITQHKEFAYTSDGKLQMWKFWNIGCGKIIKLKTLKKIYALTETQQFFANEPFPIVQNTEEGIDIAHDDAHEEYNNFEDDNTGEAIDSDSPILICPTCNKKYRSKANYAKHCETCEVQTKRTLDDFAKLTYKDAVDSIFNTNPQTQAIDENQMEVDEENALEEGWALKGARKRTTISQKQKLFLKELFDKGEKSRSSKVSNQQAAKLMKIAKNADGSLRFSADEFLTPQQIQGQFYQFKCNIL